MGPLDVVLQPSQQPIWVNILVVATAAAPILVVGGRMSRAADVIGGKTTLGQGVAGLVLLAFGTSLPDIAITTTAVVIGDVTFAVAGVMGAVAFLPVSLAIADVASGPRPLTFETPDPADMLQAVLFILLAASAVLLLSVGEVASLGGVGAGSTFLLVAYVAMVVLVRRYPGQGTWRPVHPPDRRPARSDGDGDGGASLRRAVVVMLGGAAVVLGAGIVVGRTGSSLAEQTGLGPLFMGATLVAAVTALPELTTTVSAARRGSERLALSNVVGTQALNVALLFVLDVAYRDGLILDEGGAGAQFLGTLAIALTAVYVIGLLERRNRTLLHLGLDSVVVLLLYALAVLVLGLKLLA